LLDTQDIVFILAEITEAGSLAERDRVASDRRH
jgi:hypothetical protein